LIPATAAVEASLRPGDGQTRAREACAFACHAIADVLETNEGPKAAITWYRRAIALVPDYTSAWREMGICQSEMGQFAVARSSIVNALLFDPSDELAGQELASLDSTPPEPRYTLGDPCWAAAEALAINEPDQALAALEGHDSSTVTLWRAFAHAAAGDSTGVFAQLEQLIRFESAYLLPELWFFLPPALWRDPRVWRCLEQAPLDSDNFIPQDRAWLPAPTGAHLSTSERIRLQIRALEERSSGPTFPDRVGDSTS
jgi:tetratricopeptide (TPR) repeat protein